jgi:hypothetical protein
MIGYADPFDLSLIYGRDELAAFDHPTPHTAPNPFFRAPECARLYAKKFALEKAAGGPFRVNRDGLVPFVTVPLDPR